MARPKECAEATTVLSVKLQARLQKDESLGQEEKHGTFFVNVLFIKGLGMNKSCMA